MNAIVNICSIVFTIAFLHIAFCNAKNITEDNLTRQHAQYNKYVQAKISAFKLRIHEILTAEHLVHNKHESSLSIPYKDIQNGFSLKNELSPASNLFENVEGEPAIVGANNGSVYFLHKKDAHYMPFAKFSVPHNIIKLQVFSSSNQLWLIIHYQINSTTERLQLYSYDGISLIQQQEIELFGKSLIAGTFSKNSFYLAVVSLSSSFKESIFLLYKWKGSQFDKIISSELTDLAKTLSVWDIDGILYANVGLQSNPSWIFECIKTEPEGKIMLVQFVEMDLPQFSKHFVIDNIHYLLLVNEKQADIYWWIGSQFILWQTLELNLNDDPIDSIVLQHKRYTLALVSRREIVYFIQDDTTHFIRHGVRTLSDAPNLKSFVMWQNLCTYSVLSQFVSLFEVQDVSLPVPNLVDPLKSCLKDVESLLVRRNEKLGELHSRQNKIWMKNNTLKLKAKILVNGVVESTFLKNEDIVISVENSTSLLPNEIEDDVNLQTAKGNSMELMVDDVVLKSTNQTIKSGIQFIAPVLMTKGSLNVIAQVDLDVNKVRVSQLRSALKQVGDQSFDSDVTIHSLKSNTVQIFSSLNRVKIEELILLEGKQLMRGYIQCENITGSSISLAPTDSVNGLSLGDIVLTSDNSDIMDKKSFNVMSAANINSGYMLDLNRIDQRIIYVDDDRIVTNELNFSSNLNVIGSLTARGIVASQLESLAVSSVKKFLTEVINGGKRFSQSLKIKNDTSIDGILNNVQLNGIITLSGAQDIKGYVSFDDIKFQSDIDSYDINGIDFNEDVITSQNNVVFGQKMFSQDIQVLDDIYMAKDGLINDISISELQRSVATKYSSTFENSVHLVDINIGNMTISEHLNFPIFQLRKQVWVKSYHQEILYPISVEVLKLQNLNVEKLNYALFNSFIPRTGNSNIKDTMVFTESTFINTLSLRPTLTINGYTLSSFDAVNPSYDYMSSISDAVRIHSMVINGPVQSLSSLNLVDFPSGFLLSHGFQVSSGKKFSKIYTKKASAENAAVSVINGIRFSLYLIYAVKKHSNEISLLGKTFRNIHANDLYSEGSISNVSLQEFFQRAVMLNTIERIHSQKEFFSIEAPEFKNSAFFGFTLSSLMSSIIMKDVTVISGVKRFQKLTYMKNLNVQFLNGLNITNLQQFALSKTAPSTMWGYIIFKKNLICNNGLMIDSNQALDEVLLESVSKVNTSDFFALPVTFSNIKVENHVNVGGLINRCNITNVFKNALYIKEKVQVFTAKMEFSYLNILKKLNAHCSINGVSKTQLRNIVDRNKNISLSHNIYFVNISVHNLLLKSSSNGADLSFLMSDAVKKSIPQVIIGHNYFPSVEMKHLFVRSLHVKGHVNNIYFHELFETALTKQGVQTVNSTSKFVGISSANVDIKGKLNMIKIPEDVMLTGTSNLVDSHVIFNTTITMHLNLNVSGRIDNIVLASELQEQFLLDDDSIIFSDLIFLDDVNIAGAAVVKGSLNLLLVRNFVPLKFKSVGIEGKKIFRKDLNVRKKLTAKQGINEINVSNLIESILKINIDENVKHLEFNRAFIVQAPLKITNNVNGVVIGSIWDQIHKKIENVENESSFAIMFANQQEEFLNLIKDPVLIFAYFELHQRIHLGPTLNFLPVIRSGMAEQTLGIHHASMIVWTDNCKSDTVCCNDVKSLRMKIFSNGTLDFVKDYNGKVFQHFLKNQQQTRNNVKGFLLQNAALNGAGSCKGHYETVIKTCFVGKRRNTNFLQYYPHAIINAIFMEVENDVYVAILYDSKVSSVILYQYNWTEDSWIKKQQLGSPNPISLDITYLEKESSDSYIFLAISYNNTEVPLSIYLWDMLEKNFFEWGNITAARPSSTVFWVDNRNDFFLFVANEKSSIRKDNTLVYVYTDPIQVYKLEQSNLVLFQTIDVGGIYSFGSFKLPGESYVLAVSRYMQTVYVIQWKGFNRFQVIQAIPSPGVLRASPFFPENGQLMLAVSSLSGHTKILRSVIREISLITE